MTSPARHATQKVTGNRAALFGGASGILLVVDLMDVWHGGRTTPTWWFSVMVAGMTALVALYPRVGGGLTLAVCVLGILLPDRVVAVGVVSFCIYLIVIDWVAQGWYLPAVLTVPAYALAASSSSEIYRALENTAFYALVCGLTGEVIGRLRRHASLLTDRMRLLEAERNLAEARVRSDLGAVLHDTVATDLTVVLMRLRLAAQDLGPEGGRLGAVEEAVHVALDDVRRLIDTARSPASRWAEETSLPQVLKECEVMLQGRSVTVQAEPERLELGSEVPQRVEQLLGHVLRECAINTLKYAPAGSGLSIVLEQQESVVALTVVSLIGSREETRLSGGHGLPIMRERVRAAGGVLETRELGGTWMVMCTVPVAGEGLS